MCDAFQEDRAANVATARRTPSGTRLERMFSCENGLCRNITGAHACSYKEENVAPPPGVTCIKKHNCVELTGMFDCRRGRCRRVERWHCERREVLRTTYVYLILMGRAVDFSGRVELGLA